MSDIPELKGPRENLDRINGLLLQLLAARSREVGKIAVIKARQGIEAHQPNRFQEMLDGLQADAVQLEVRPELVTAVWNAIHEDSLKQQQSVLDSQE